MTDLNDSRYTNGVTRSTVQEWLEQADNVNNRVKYLYNKESRIIKLCMSWLDIEQQLVEARKEINTLELRVEYLMYEEM